MRASSALRTRLTLREHHATSVAVPHGELTHHVFSLHEQHWKYIRIGDRWFAASSQIFVSSTPLPPTGFTTPVVIDLAGHLHTSQGLAGTVTLT